MSSATGTLSRLQALRIVARWLQSGAFPDRLLPEEDADRGFIMDLVYGVVRGRRRLEWVLGPLVRRQPPAPARAALLLGAQQLLFMPDVADHAALHATVEAVKRETPGAAGFVNAVLRGVLRRRAELLAALALQPPAVRHSHPDLLVERWSARYGAEAAESLCRWNNEPAETVVVLLPGADAAELTRRWRAQGVAVRPHSACAAALIVPHGARVERLEGFAQNLFVPQDPATLAAVELLRARPGLRVLDACAAPGGKTVQLAARMERQGELVAMELHADRLPRLRENLRRQGLDSWVRVVQGDAAAMGEGGFDRILLDAPCSNTGVLRRRPDARWRFSLPRLRALVQEQRRLLTHLLPLLAPGGRLVYSTCSLEPEENEELLAGVCGKAAGWHVAESSARRPDRDGMDGAFAAAIEAIGR
jgi:16S rRNA (cytosine967-C5)-methyltransferase